MAWLRYNQLPLLCNSSRATAHAIAEAPACTTRTVDLVLGEVEAGLKKSKKEGRYTIGNFGTFTITRRPARKGRNPQTGEAIRIKASKVLKFRPAAALKRVAGA